MPMLLKRSSFRNYYFRSFLIMKECNFKSTCICSCKFYLCLNLNNKANDNDCLNKEIVTLSDVL